jgi:formate dehydrogenase accessory protein FdhD
MREALNYAGRRWRSGIESEVEDAIAEEIPVALVYNGISHVVMLATPLDLEEFALGFSLSEGIVGAAREVRDIEIHAAGPGIEVRLDIASERFQTLKERRRNLAGRTGCGLCGTESLEQVLRPLPKIAPSRSIAPQSIHAAFAALQGHQRLHALTGAVHAAAWARTDGSLTLVREDVGRHNALDKLIGAMAFRDAAFDTGFAIITSRASSEMVQKAATLRVPLLAAISAPTGLAIRLARECGLMLVGFARGASHVVYSEAAS